MTTETTPLTSLAEAIDRAFETWQSPSVVFPLPRSLRNHLAAHIGRALLDVTQVDGPHSPERTAEAAGLIPAAVRFLNYATMPSANAPGIDYAGDVDNILGAIRTAADGLQQTLSQCSKCLQDELATGLLRLDSGRPFADDPPAAVAMACDKLESALHACGDLRTALDGARRTTAGMYRDDG